MAIFDEIKKPTMANLLICFYDLSRFVDVAKKVSSSLELFDVLDGMAVTTIRFMANTKGRIIKFIGDSALIVYPEEAVDEGIQQLLELRTTLEKYFKSRELNTKVTFGVHFGEVAIGPYGEKPHQSIDVMGDHVNKAAILAGRDYKNKFVISPQAFRKLQPETRKLFHKFTPPIVYVAE